MRRLTRSDPPCYHAPSENSSPHRLVWPRTPAFQAGNTGSNPVGDAIIGQPLNFGSAAVFFSDAGLECLLGNLPVVLKKLTLYNEQRPLQGQSLS